MSSEPIRIREVVEEDRFQEERDDLSASVRRWDEVMFGVTYTLARAPEIGHETWVEGVFALATDPFPDAPDLVVYYRYDDERVHLLSVIEPRP